MLVWQFCVLRGFAIFQKLFPWHIDLKTKKTSYWSLDGSQPPRFKSPSIASIALELIKFFEAAFWASLNRQQKLSLATPGPPPLVEANRGDRMWMGWDCGTIGAWYLSNYHSNHLNHQKPGQVARSANIAPAYSAGAKNISWPAKTVDSSSKQLASQTETLQDR